MSEGESGFTFKASRGWFEKFKDQSGIHSVVTHGEASSSCSVHVGEFSDFVNAGGYLPQQVFNCDETGLFLKKDAKQDLHNKGRKIHAWAQTHEG